MDKLAAHLQKFRSFNLLYIATLLLAFHFYFFYYVNSNFLNQYYSETGLAILYALGGVINLLIFLNISAILRSFSNYRLMLVLIVLEGICLVGMAELTEPITIAILFIATQVINPILLFNIDIFLENISSDDSTGDIRGMYLFAGNIPPIVCPFIAGIILATPDYWKVYAIGAAFLIPLFYLISAYFRDFKDPEYTDLDIMGTLKEVKNNKNIRNIFVSDFLLNFFYTWMGIYIPIYLYKYVGFTWPQMGLIFSIMLLPFLFFQLPLGHLADKKYGEKEILIVGFVIMGAATMLIPYIATPSLILWAAILFTTRIGASFVEVAAEVYFFKKINVKDTNLIGIFRTIKTLPYIISPIIAVICIAFMPFKFIFLVLGLLMFLGLRYALPIEDTR